MWTPGGEPAFLEAMARLDLKTAATLAFQGMNETSPLAQEALEECAACAARFPSSAELRSTLGRNSFPILSLWNALHSLNTALALLLGESVEPLQKLPSDEQARHQGLLDLSLRGRAAAKRHYTRSVANACAHMRKLLTHFGQAYKEFIPGDEASTKRFRAVLKFTAEDLGSSAIDLWFARQFFQLLAQAALDAS